MPLHAVALQGPVGRSFFEGWRQRNGSIAVRSGPMAQNANAFCTFPDISIVSVYDVHLCCRPFRVSTPGAWVGALRTGTKGAGVGGQKSKGALLCHLYPIPTAAPPPLFSTPSPPHVALRWS